MSNTTPKNDGLDSFVCRVEANAHLREALDALNNLHQDSRSAFLFVELVRIAFHDHGELSRDHINGFARFVESLAKHVRKATDNLAEAHRLMRPEDYVEKEPYVAPTVTEIAPEDPRAMRLHDAASELHDRVCCDCLDCENYRAALQSHEALHHYGEETE